MRIREHRKARGLTVQQLAEKIGVTKGYVSEMETGKKTPGAKMVMFLAEALCVPVSDLYDAESPTDAKTAEIEAHVEVMMRLSEDHRRLIEAAARDLLSKRDESS